MLDGIHRPQDLRRLTRGQLARLAREIRAEIIATVQANGGHLASNLGVVELTLALHRVFDSPRDKLLWDTSHQAYAHKLVTGRAGRFRSLRQPGGLSGFAAREESPHDVMGAGHAGTGVSTGVGIALAQRLRAAHGLSVPGIVQATQELNQPTMRIAVDVGRPIVRS